MQGMMSCSGMLSEFWKTGSAALTMVPGVCRVVSQSGLKTVVRNGPAGRQGLWARQGLQACHDQ